MSETIADREPRIFDVAELPEREKGTRCPMYFGDRPRRCNNPVGYVFVYEATVDPEDDRRKNCLCCAECKPAVTKDDTLRADGGMMEDDTDWTWEDVERLLRDLKADGYDPTLLETVTSAAAPTKSIQINVKRDVESGGDQ